MKSLKLLLVLSMAWAARQAPQCDENAMLQAESPRPRGYRRRPRSSRSFALPLGYTILGPGRQVVARLLLPITVPCPAELRVTMGDRKQLVPVRVRAEPHFGIHGAWFTEGQRFQHLTGTNYAFANPISPFAYEDQVCEAPFVPEFLGEGIVAAFQLQDGSSVKVPMPARQPKRFLVMGDTGLRIKAGSTFVRYSSSTAQGGGGSFRTCLHHKMNHQIYHRIHHHHQIIHNHRFPEPMPYLSHQTL